ncbi:MAG TPA: hypothetical protein VHJ17_00220 [Thermomonospora sp.]|nr:hypothetical protein [Thermomonospora sp.]
MGVPDDFDLWERELREPREPPPLRPPEAPGTPETTGTPETPKTPEAVEAMDEQRTSGRTMTVGSLAAVGGGIAVMVLGRAPLGAAALLLSALIMLLWRVGL